MSKVVIINGSGRVGKDTFCLLCGKYADISICSSVSGVKAAALHLGWDGQKDDRSRKFLSDLKDLATAYSDAPMNLMRDFVRTHQNIDEIIFLMIREPEEIEKAKREFGAVTLLIERPQAGTIASNHADQNVAAYAYDFVISNSGGLSDLERLAQNFVSALRS